MERRSGAQDAGAGAGDVEWTPDELKRAIDEQRERGERPFGVTHCRARVRLDPARGRTALLGTASLSLTPGEPREVAIERLSLEGVTLFLRPRCRVRSVKFSSGGRGMPMPAPSFRVANPLESPAPPKSSREGLDRWLRHYRAAQADTAVVGELMAVVPRALLQGDVAELTVHIEYEAEWACTCVRYAWCDETRERTGAVQRAQRLCWTENSEADCAPHWVPCVDDPGETCTWTLEVVVPNGNDVAASGTLVAREPCAGDEGWTLFKYELSEAVPARSVGFVAGEIEGVKDTRGDPRAFAVCPAGRLEHARYFFDESGAPGKALRFCESLVGTLPWPWMCFAFVPDPGAYPVAGAFAGLAVLPESLLHGPDVLDAHDETATAAAAAVARQWFGALLGPRRWEQDQWLVAGLASWLTREFLTRFLGTNHTRYALACDMAEAAKRLPWRAPVSCVVPASQAAYVHPSEMTEASSSFALRASMVVHMLGRKAGAAALAEVARTVVAEGIKDHTPIATEAFLDKLSSRSGQAQELRTLAERWVTGRGFPPMHAGFFYNRKTHILEFALRVEPDTEMPGSSGSSQPDSQSSQSLASGAPARKEPCTGKVVVRQWEADVTRTPPTHVPYENEVTFDSEVNFIQIMCHSKTRKQRKRRNPPPGAEADPSAGGEGGAGSGQAPALVAAGPPMIHGNYRTGIPVFWLRLDPEMDFVHKITLRQSEYMWLNQLERDRDVVAQREAIEGIVSRGGSRFSAGALLTVLRNSTTYWRVRVDAARGLARLPWETDGPRMLLDMCRALAFSSHPFMEDAMSKGKLQDQMLPNQVPDLPSYYIAREAPLALALSRGPGAVATPPEAIELLQEMIDNNDNTDNQYSDGYLQASRARALGLAVYGGPTASEMAQKSVKQLQRLLEADSIIPSHRNVITCACLASLAALHSVAPQPVLKEQLWAYFHERAHGAEVRLAAIEAYISVFWAEKLRRLFEILEDESELTIVRRGVARAFLALPRSQLEERLNGYNVEKNRGSQYRSAAASHLWNILNGSATAYDSVLRCLVVDMYQRIWGLGSPKPFMNAPRGYSPDDEPSSKRARQSSPAAEPKMTVIAKRGGPPPAAGGQICSVAYTKGPSQPR